MNTFDDVFTTLVNFDNLLSLVIWFICQLYILINQIIIRRILKFLSIAPIPLHLRGYFVKESFAGNWIQIHAVLSHILLIGHCLPYRDSVSLSAHFARLISTTLGDLKPAITTTLVPTLPGDCIPNGEGEHQL